MGKDMDMPTHTWKNKPNKPFNWARLVSKNIPHTITILVTLDHNWYHNLNPHMISHTITYEEPINPPEIQLEPRIESHDVHTLCVHHKGTPTGSEEYIQQMHNIANTLQISAIFTQPTPPTYTARHPM
jgi:hypothetical protein